MDALIELFYLFFLGGQIGIKNKTKHKIYIAMTNCLQIVETSDC